MRKIYLLPLLLIFSTLSGQISISKFSMPSVGETLKTYTSINPSVDLGTVSANQTWDFSNLSKDNYQEINLLNPSEGTVSVPSADFLIKTGPLVEQYYSKSPESIQEILLKTLDPVFETFEIVNTYAENPVYRKGTIIYNQNYESSSRFEAPIAWDDLPDTITSGINLNFDSIKINTNISIQDDIDAYGVATLPDGQWNVLRESTKTIRSITLDVFFLGVWIEAPLSVLEVFLGDFAAILQPDTSYSINFYTDEAIEVLASFQLDGENGDPISVTYKAGSEITPINSFDSLKKPSVTTFPNPSYGNVTFSFDNCRPGNYTIQVYDIIGKKLWNKSHLHKSNTPTFRADLSSLKKGTYLYSIYDSKGNKITTKRLVIINP